MFVWQAYHDAILTNENRFKRQITQQANCDLCNDEIESTLHALWDCPHARYLWQNLIELKNWRLFFTMPLKEWIKSNITQLEAKAALFATAAWWA